MILSLKKGGGQEGAALGPHFAMDMRGSQGGRAEVSRASSTSLGYRVWKRWRLDCSVMEPELWDSKCGAMAI